MTDETEETGTAEPEAKEEAPKPVTYKVPKSHRQTLRLIATLRQQGAAPLIEQIRQIEQQIRNVFAGAAGELAKLLRNFDPDAKIGAGSSVDADNERFTITVTPPSASTEGPQEGS